MPKKTPTTTLHEEYQRCPNANLWRRMAAFVYDLFAIGAILMLATGIAILLIIILTKVGIIDITPYQDIADYLAHNSFFAFYLGLVIVTFYSYFWTHAGQTLGMKAWRLRVQNNNGQNITQMQSFIRMATSAFGLGNLMAIFPNKNAFQDLWAECKVVVLSKKLNNRKI
ncbi:RDD family protein [Psychromonas sp. CD1]|uniref:RDD family protein n=1 Tax=Psychromonas sp. CD1 TaxID=1979839 RepID=UPI000B9B2F17|nr:RDD family protein [Psychromonas sp. CD1]